MKRTEKKLFSIADRLEQLNNQQLEVEAELAELREIAAESASDAVYYDEALDRKDARLTSADVKRFERILRQIDFERTVLERKRGKLLDRLGG